MKNIPSKILFVFVCFLSSSNFVIAVELGREIGGVRLKLPAVPGLTNVEGSGKRTALAVAATDSNGHFVAGLANDNFGKYIIVMMPKFMVNANMSQGEFRDVLDQMRASSKNLERFGHLANNQFLRERDTINATTKMDFRVMKFGVPYFVERVHDNEDRFGDITITRIQGDIGGKPVDYNALICSPLVRLKAKVFVLKVIAVQRTPEDSVWVRNVCKSFTDSLISLN